MQRDTCTPWGRAAEAGAIANLERVEDDPSLDSKPAESQRHAQFSVGQVIHHRLFEYRGVVVDVDPTFQGTEEWYEAVARSRPPRDQPWYHVLVHGAEHATYVAERNLEAAPSDEPIDHPLLAAYFDAFRDGRYQRSRSIN